MLPYSVLFVLVMKNNCSPATVCTMSMHNLPKGGREIPCCDIFEVGSEPIHIHNVTCLGSEANITECSYLNTTAITSYQHNVGVQCEQG